MLTGKSQAGAALHFAPRAYAVARCSSADASRLSLISPHRSPLPSLLLRERWMLTAFVRRKESRAGGADCLLRVRHALLRSQE